MYLSALIAGTTILRAAAQQIYRCIDGKDPRDMTKGNFWLNALLKGGLVRTLVISCFRPDNAYWQYCIWRISWASGLRRL